MLHAYLSCYATCNHMFYRTTAYLLRLLCILHSCLTYLQPTTLSLVTAISSTTSTSTLTSIIASSTASSTTSSTLLDHLTRLLYSVKHDHFIHFSLLARSLRLTRTNPNCLSNTRPNPHLMKQFGPLRWAVLSILLAQSMARIDR